MKVDQLSIFLENRAGRLAEVTKILSDNKINIRALSLADTTDFGILRLIVSDFDKAKAALKEHGFTVGRTTVVAVKVSDTPGGLNSILEMMGESNINVEYMYAFVAQSGAEAVIIMRFDRTDQALEILAGKGVETVPGEVLYNL